jgi:hypothetical protein
MLEYLFFLFLEGMKCWIWENWNFPRAFGNLHSSLSFNWDACFSLFVLNYFFRWVIWSDSFLEISQKCEPRCNPVSWSNIISLFILEFLAYCWLRLHIVDSTLIWHWDFDTKLLHQPFVWATKAIQWIIRTCILGCPMFSPSWRLGVFKESCCFEHCACWMNVLEPVLILSFLCVSWRHWKFNHCQVSNDVMAKQASSPLYLSRSCASLQKWCTAFSPWFRAFLEHPTVSLQCKHPKNGPSCESAPERNTNLSCLLKTKEQWLLSV